MKKLTPILRGDTYYIRMRVPKRYASIDPRTFVKLSLATDSLELARRKAPEVWAQMIEAWEAKLDGHVEDGDARMKAARNLAQRRGYRYLDAADVSRLPVAEIVARAKSVVDRRGRLDMKEADAALGLVPVPTVTVSEAVEEFYKVAGDRILGKNDDQIRRHKAPRLKATKNWIAAVGDKSLADVTTDDWFRFRAALLADVASGKYLSASANKDITYLSAMWTAIAQVKQIPLAYSVKGVPLKDSKAKKRTRLPFTDDWIRKKIIEPGVLDGLNADARYILLGMVNTGYRPSEGAGLLPEEIMLDGKVPHILIQPNKNRALKNEHSERYIPLTGVSLDAFREMKNGFPRYALNSSGLSATVNKFLTENKLLETPAHSLYGLRHSFEDRMLMGGVDERIRRDLMGHGLKREKYGRGGDMEHIHALMLPLAL